MTSYEQIEAGWAGCLLSLGCGKQPFDPLKKGVLYNQGELACVFKVLPFLMLHVLLK